MTKKASDTIKKVWKFLWEDDSIWSWIANIVIAFVLIKFIIFPGLGLILGTSYPVVAVVSGSMEHSTDFDDWWHSQETIYQRFNISRQDFEEFPLKDGFNRGDIIFLRGVNKDDLKVGDIIVFKSQDFKARPDPIIHRAILIKRDEPFTIQTKGDHNFLQIQGRELDETKIAWDQVVGKAWIRIPMLGYIKIWFVDLINMIGNTVR